MDECNEGDINHANCSQLCNNTDGSYQCYCQHGYALDPSDETTCHGVCIVLQYLADYSYIH